MCEVALKRSRSTLFIEDQLFRVARRQKVNDVIEILIRHFARLDRHVALDLCVAVSNQPLLRHPPVLAVRSALPFQIPWPQTDAGINPDAAKVRAS